MSFTIYSGVTLNGIDIDSMIDDNNDYVHFSDKLHGFFVRLSGQRDNTDDELNPALVLFSDKDSYKPLYARVLDGSYSDYLDEFDRPAGSKLDAELNSFFDECQTFCEGMRLKEEIVWRNAYCIYDDNLHHALNAFISNGYSDYDFQQLHQENLEFIRELRDNYGDDLIRDVDATLIPYLDEIKALEVTSKIDKSKIKSQLHDERKNLSMNVQQACGSVDKSVEFDGASLPF